VASPSCYCLARQAVGRILRISCNTTSVGDCLRRLLRGLGASVFLLPLELLSESGVVDCCVSLLVDGLSDDPTNEDTVLAPGVSKKSCGTI
jgi:hypothetical protein